MSSTRVHRTATGTIATLIGLGAAGAAIAATSPAGEPSVLVLDQKLQNGQVMIDYANLPAKGYIAIYGSDDKGQPSGPPIGSVAVAPGDHRNVKVMLDRAPKSGERLWASLYTDADNTPQFTPGKGDTPVWSKLPAENAFTVR